MKRYISVGTVCWAALAVVMTAQSGAQTPERRSPAGTKRKSGPSLTVTGCLQPGASTPDAATDRSGALPGSPMNGTGVGPEFILMNVSTSGSARSGARAGSGTRADSGSGSSSAAGGRGSETGRAGRGGAAASRAGYQLYGNVGEMNKLVNRRVQVTGTLDTQTGGDGKAAGSMSGAGTTSSPMRRLNVTSFRDVSVGATCSVGGQ